MTKKTVIAMMDEAASKFRDKPYLCNKTDDGWDKVSFQQAKKISRQLAAGLINRGFKKEDKAVIISEGRSEWVLSELALIRTGAISVPLSLKLLPEEVPFRINHSESRAVFFSHITWEKVISVKEQFEKDLLYVCLDSSDELLNTIAEKGGLTRGKNLISYQELLKEGTVHFRFINEDLSARENAIEEDDTVNICYTSGTTGNPKGIMLTHMNYYTNCTGSAATVTIPLYWQTLVILPIDHSFAHTVALYIAFLRAISLYFVDARGGSMSILRNIPVNLKEVNPHFLLTVPAITGNFMKKMKAGISAKGGKIADLFNKGLNAGILYHGNGFNKPPFSVRFKAFWPYTLCKILIFPKLKEVFGKNIKFCIGGGALLDVKQQEFYNTIGVPVFQGYGLTEASPVISSNSKKSHKFGTSGRLLTNIEVKILDSEGKEAPPGVRGQIAVKGGSVMKGYYRNPEATEKTLVDGWLHSGDLGYMEEDGFLMVVGREKALLISGDGEKYSPEEIEEGLMNCSDLVDQVMLYCDHKNYTTALLVLDKERLKKMSEGKSEDQILNWINDEMNSYKNDPAYKGKFPKQWTPSSFQILTEPFTEQNKMINSSLKMVRYKITEAYKERIEYMYSSEGQPFLNPKNREALKVLLD